MAFVDNLKLRYNNFEVRCKMNATTIDLTINSLTLTKYQELIKNELSRIFKDTYVESEWKSDIHPSIYSPRLDIAVGPFAKVTKKGYMYDEMINDIKIKSFLRKLIHSHNQNISNGNYSETLYSDVEKLKYTNHNARCFISLEIENKVSRKHLLGGAINACALGRIAVVMPWTDEKLRAFLRMIEYFKFLREADKNTFNLDNLLLVTKEQFFYDLINTINE